MNFAKFWKFFDRFLLAFLLVFLLFYYIPFFPIKIEDIFLIIVSVVAFIPVVFSAIRALFNKKISVDLLASVALLASFLTGEWASAVFINLMLTSARIFGEYTDSRARRAIASLMKLRPDKVKIKQGDQIIEIKIEEVKIGDQIIIESGDRVPVDGTVLAGTGTLDQSSLTGESVPITKNVGDEIFSSTLNVAGSLVIRAEKIGQDTTLEKIIRLVESSHKEKGKINTTADKFASWYIALTFIGAILVYFIFRDTKLLLSLLLVACADDLAVAIPMAFLVAIGYAARRGVIIKGSSYLEGLTKVKTIITDKTGTLTLGKLVVEKILPFGRFSENKLLELAASAEIYSEHPLAKAIIGHAKNKNIKIHKLSNYHETPGKGICGYSNEKLIIAGNRKFIEDKKVHLNETQLKQITEVENLGFNVVVVASGNLPVGMLGLADQIRPNTKNIIAKLHELGIKKFIMLTGDNEHVARRVCKEVGIDEYHANFLPQDKQLFLKRELSAKHKTAMIGDGVNDAAALALADIGISMGSIGSDAAIESSDIALMKDDLAELPEMLRLSKYTLKIAKQDFIIWGVVNLIGLALVFARVIGPEGAAAFNFATDFFPLLNSFRLFNLHRHLNDKDTKVYD